jgi:hypothetical protein
VGGRKRERKRKGASFFSGAVVRLDSARFISFFNGQIGVVRFSAAVFLIVSAGVPLPSPSPTPPPPPTAHEEAITMVTIPKSQLRIEKTVLQISQN